MPFGIEKQIMEFCTLQSEEINDETIQEKIEELKKYEMK